jgi:protein TonB
MEVVMFATLLESGTTLRRRPGTVSLSAVLHIALVAGGVALSQHRPIEKTIIDFPGHVVYVDPRVRTTGQRAATGTSRGGATNGPRFHLPDLSGFDIETPSGVGEVPLGDASVSGADAGSGVGGGAASSDAIYSAAVVEKSAIALSGNRTPIYPELLRKAGIEGSVLVQFIIDTTGRLEPGSVRILKSQHELFSAAVRNALLNHRFLPAEAGGRKVRTLVEQRFDFAIEH